MSSAAEDILEAALALPEDERERLALRLIATLGRETADEIAEAWDAEIARRIRAREHGASEARPWKDVYAELRAKHARGG